VGAAIFIALEGSNNKYAFEWLIYQLFRFKPFPLWW
jgi:hypothetical protein